MSFPKAVISKPLEVGQDLVIDVSQVPEFKRFYLPKVTDVSFKLIEILNYSGKTFYVVHDGRNIFSIEIEIPQSNALAKEFLDNEY